MWCTEGPHIQEGREGDVPVVLPEVTARLQEPLQVEVEHQRRGLYEQLLSSFRENHTTLFLFMFLALLLGHTICIFI